MAFLHGGWQQVIVARYHTIEGITLEQMSSYRSCDYWDGVVLRELPGMCATTYLEFLLHLMAGGCIHRLGYDPRVCLRGEVLVLDADDTGERCMDRQPVVIPREILLRIRAADFLNQEYVRGNSTKMEGPKFHLVDRLLNCENVSKWKLERERALARKKLFRPRWTDIWGGLQKH